MCDPLSQKWLYVAGADMSKPQIKDRQSLYSVLHLTVYFN